MLSAAEEKELLTRAYVPEHLVGLMTCVSGGEPFVIEEYFCCVKGKWLIVVGYPLQDDFQPSGFEMVLERMIRRFRPQQISLIAPQLPPSLVSKCQERGQDWYYTLASKCVKTHSGIKRLLEKASRKLTLERSTRMQDAHLDLMDEFLQRIQPPPRIAALYRKMPDYVGISAHSMVINAWSQGEKLAGFYVVDLSATDFAAYVVGCHSKRHYVAGVSDLLFYDMIQVGRQYGKRYFHLGLGVNEGIRRFKEKWGGIASRPYQMCESSLRQPSWLDLVLGLAGFKSAD